MSRGRKAKTTSTGLDWEQIFNNSLGFYFQYIIIQLGRKNRKLSAESANDLLKIINQEKLKLIAEKKVKKDKILPKIEAEEIPFEIPLNWVWCRLGEIGYWASGSGFPTNYQGQKEQPILFSKVSDMNLPENSKFLVRTENSIDEETAKKIGATPHKAGTVIFPKIGGAIATNKRRILTRPTAIDNNCLGITPSNFCDSIWLYYLLSSIDFAKYQAGTSIPALNQGVIEKILVAIPPLSEQKLILDFLQDFGKNAIDENREYFDSEIENKIVSFHQAQIYNNQISTELNHQLALVKELRQAYLREAMQGKLARQDSTDEPAEILLEKIKAEKEKLVAEKRIRRDKPLPPINAEEIPFEIPSNWTWCRLGEITNYGSSLKAEPSDLSDDTWVLDLEDIEKETSKLLCKVRFLERNSLSTKSIFKKDNVLYSKLRPYLDKVIVADENGVCTTEILPLECFGDLSPHFLRFALKRSDFLKYVNSVTKGMKMPRLGTKEGQLALIPLPPLAEQERIVAKLEKLMKFCDELEANIRQGIANADQLLQTALKEALEPR